VWRTAVAHGANAQSAENVGTAATATGSIATYVANAAAPPSANADSATAAESGAAAALADTATPGTNPPATMTWPDHTVFVTRIPGTVRKVSGVRKNLTTRSWLSSSRIAAHRRAR
jgi:hypothetical protein